MPRQRDSAAKADAAHGGDAPLASEADTEPPDWLALDIVAEAAAFATMTSAETLVEAAAAALAGHPAFAGSGPGLACIALADDATVRGLNRDHRAKDTPTNVLSFPAREGESADGVGRDFLGDVILAGETVLAEAREQAIPPAHHLQHLVVHGLLHLLGFDHEDDDEAEAMEALEAEILGRLGIPDPHQLPRRLP